MQALASGVGPVLLRFVYSRAKDSPLGPGAMFVFAGGLYLVAVAAACALPKEKANARKEEFDSEAFADLLDDTESYEEEEMVKPATYGSI